MDTGDPSAGAPDYLVAKDARVQAFWAAFCAHAGVPADTPYQAWHFGDSAELAHELLELVLYGEKRATAGLHWLMEKHPELAPVPRGYSVLTEFDGRPRAVIRTTTIELRAFEDVDAQLAWDEGEGDRTLATWRSDHWAYFSRECEKLGRTPSPTMQVVIERFELLYPGGS